MKNKSKDIIMQNKVFGRIALATGLILLVPLVAMQFTNEVKWTPLDFIVMGTFIFSVWSLFVLVARKFSKKYWLAIGMVFAIAFLYIWAELAVGVFTDIGS